jgi:outer membrane lipoprotein-sorting protein
MKRKASLIAFLAVALALPLLSLAQEGPLNPAEPKGITVDQIIQRFAAKEKEFKQARDSYTYRQDVKVQTVDGGSVDGEYHQVVDVTFDDKGRRQERVVFAPQSSLQRVSMTREDVDDIQHRLPFVLTSDEIPEYQILYAGQQQEDELHCYVFDIAPKQIERDKRYFQGRIWVDDRDFQIVKTHGKTVPDIRKKKNEENLFPAFTTWREQVDGKYWFPTYTKADDDLHFSGGDVHIREIVKYTNYKRFGANVKITYEGQELPKGQGDQQPPGQPQAQQQTPPK